VHPAESRVRKLAAETPALLIAFDCLATGDAGSLLGAHLPERRAALERIMPGFRREDRVRLSPFTRDHAEAERWLLQAHGALDGIVAKRLDAPYACGKRDMLKLKTHRTVDCVVGGFRYATGTRQVGSLLLGLYDGDGKLDHVGFTSAISDADRPALTERVEALLGGEGFTGDAPGGPSRWSTGRSAEWQALRPELVVEVSYDQVTDGRFRHGTMLVRWRPDKAPRQCTREQVGEELRPGKLVQAILQD
jgi:ATP-dependent DNA ligase